MGQKVHSTGFRLGVSQGWDSSWSLDPAQKGHNYRHYLHMDLEIRNLIAQLFVSKNGYVGKIGISKNSSTGVIDISVFGYVPGQMVTEAAPGGSVKLTAKKQLQKQLKKLVIVFNEKYAPEVITLSCVLIKGFVVSTNKKQRGKYNKGQSKSLQIRKTRLVKGRNLTSSRVNQKESGKSQIKEYISLATKEFSFMSRNNYFETLINVVLLVFKTKQPQFLASFLARELGKTRYQRAVVNNTDAVCAFFFNKMPGLQGIRIQINGRMNKASRSRKYVTQYGRIPSQTITRPVQFGFDEAHTSFGSMGVKVWLAY
jgi:ribosomal protein S3